MQRRTDVDEERRRDDESEDGAEQDDKESDTRGEDDPRLPPHFSHRLAWIPPRPREDFEDWHARAEQHDAEVEIDEADTEGRAEESIKVVERRRELDEIENNEKRNERYRRRGGEGKRGKRKI